MVVILSRKYTSILRDKVQLQHPKQTIKLPKILPASPDFFGDYYFSRIPSLNLGTQDSPAIHPAFFTGTPYMHTKNRTPAGYSYNANTMKQTCRSYILVHLMMMNKGEKEVIHISTSDCPAPNVSWERNR